ncbi:hypothetical protein MAM1_0206d07978 [Mucor ambiguus]|uniref:Uncharacterized protein n=1 Tax=Mucor ambiguus TaxID=91626 RepID=A0A0C9MCV2_9FUNG|nr:hypothetical protein MAM1_0206d07978 [Mucor ambiguus]
MSQQNNKYHVTIEDCSDEDDHRQFSQKSADIDDIDISHINNTEDSSSHLISGGSERQAWDEVDALEEQARNEKMQNQPTAMAKARQTAHIVEEATHQSSGF